MSCRVLFRANRSSVVGDQKYSTKMIPRTSIEEANKHLSLLHKRVTELEKTVKEQHEALIAKDQFLQTKVTEISSAKNAELDDLRQKLNDSERTIFVLQKQMEQKNRTLEILQHNGNNLKSLLVHKANVRLLLQSMEETEGRLIDGNTESEGEVGSQMLGFQEAKPFHAHPNGSNYFLNGCDDSASSDVLTMSESASVQSSTPSKQNQKQSGQERRRSLRGKEFYL